MDWFDVLKIFIGFVAGYVFAGLQARRYVSRIIGGIVQPQKPSNQSTNKSIIIGRIDQTTTRKLP